MKLKRLVISGVVGGLVFSSVGCASTGEALTAEQKMMRCGAMVAGGAILGGIVGNNTGSGDAGKGALVGALAGGGACGVWLAFQNEADKRRIAEARLAALQNGEPVAESWTGTDGRVRSITVSPSTDTQMVASSAADESTANIRVCRTVSTQASVANTSDSIEEVWCRTESGDWEAANEAMTAV